MRISAIIFLGLSCCFATLLSSLLVGAQEDPSDMPSEMPSQLEDIATEVPLNGAVVEVEVLDSNEEEFVKQTAEYLYQEMMAMQEDGLLPDSIAIQDMPVTLFGVAGRRGRKNRREQRKVLLSTTRRRRAQEDYDHANFPESVEDVERAILAEEQALLLLRSRTSRQVQDTPPSGDNLVLIAIQMDISAIVTGDVDDKVVRELNRAVEMALVGQREKYQASLQSNPLVAKEIYIVRIQMLMPPEPTPSPSVGDGSGGGKKDSSSTTKAPSHYY
ncbi:hypothetical protein ACA910_004683 [Epithemia clementina (nom. ined.)]